MDNYFDTKGKSVTPEETISHIKGIFSKLGIVVIQRWNEVDAQIYSLNLRIADTCIFSNGKGLTEKYALASAYAELMERLQSMVLFRYSIPIINTSILYGNFTYSPDEKWIRYNDIDKNNPLITDMFRNSIPSEENKNNILNKIEEIFRNEVSKDDNHENSICCVPFENYFSGIIENIPLRVLDMMCGSNGLCAGNTREEAIVQGLSELCERYVNRKIIEEKITPPDIPRQYIAKNYPQIEKIIRTIEQHGFDLVIKDCSLDMKYPVVAIIAREISTAKYFIKFGASPDLGIAVERCLTEMFQGRNLKSKRWLKKRFYIEDKKFFRRNLEINLHDGNGYYPFNLFAKSERIFSEWYYKGNNNTEYLAEMTHILQENGFDIFIRDWSITSFPTYQIYIPAMSFIYTDLEERIDWYLQLKSVRNSLLHINSITLEELDTIHRFIDNNSDENTSISSFLPIPMYATNRFTSVSTELFIVATYIRYGMFEEAFNALYPVYRYSDNVMINMLAIWLISKCSGKNDNYIHEYFKINFSEVQNKDFERFFNNGNILRNYELKCFNCSECHESACCFNSISGIYNKVRKYALSQNRK